MSAPDITTLLEAFKGQVKTGSMEEQSVRTAYALAQKGDVATATNILKYIKIPEALKIQVLAAAASINPSQNFTSTAPVSAGVVGASDTPKTLPAEPLMQMSGATIRVVSDAAPVPEVVVPTRGAFEVELGASTLPAQTAYDGAGVTSADSAHLVDPVLGVPIPVAPKHPDPVPVTQSAVKPTDPMNVPAHERGQVFNSLFSQARSTSAAQTSRPMIMQDAQIPVIHTYAEPEPSQFAQNMERAELSGVGVKLFSTFGQYVARALQSDDMSVRMSARAQWDNLNRQFPDYERLHPVEWQQLLQQVTALSTAPTTVQASVQDSVISESVDTSAIVVDTPVVNDSVVTDTTPVTASTSTGGYFTRRSSPVSAVADSGTVLQTRDANVSSIQNTNDHRDSAVDSLPVTSDESGTRPVLPLTDLDKHTLQSGIVVEKNLTITGDSVFRVERIQRDYRGVVYVVFTDEIHDYVVPESSLDSALQNPDVTPDAFFQQYKPVTSGR